MSGFFAMGDYAAYVWPAYAVTLILLGGAAAMTLRAYNRAKAQLERLEKP
ncbi:MAG TPA: heme exporter protein CcmD [Rhizomicrobium sp.]|nr:heme exporter protein CcmD [Rhizomicrobium sp.]